MPTMHIVVFVGEFDFDIARHLIVFVFPIHQNKTTVVHVGVDFFDRRHLARHMVTVANDCGKNRKKKEWREGGKRGWGEKKKKSEGSQTTVERKEKRVRRGRNDGTSG